MSDPADTLDKLSGSEKFILKWLSKEDNNMLGECESLELRVLTNMKLATIVPAPADRGIGYGRVSLTDEGYEVAKLIEDSNHDR